MKGPFTGKHAAMVLGGGFAVVIAVNLTMATLAARSHPGLVVQNSYIASQKFNGWLEAGRAQKALGWTVTARADGGRLLVDATSALGTPLEGLKTVATVSHPLGRDAPLVVSLREEAPGRYAAPHGVTPGQWLVEVRLTRGSDSFYLDERLVVPG